MAARLRDGDVAFEDHWIRPSASAPRCATASPRKRTQLSCVLFRGDAVAQRGALADGRMVILKGHITVYEPRGQYQLQVLAVELQGVGALQAAFEKLKEKLGAEGFFAPERKRPLPPFPQRIGLVTSPTGAALRDVLQVMRRRNPAVEIILTPCAVQGAGAAAEIAAAISLLNDWSQKSAAPLDVILVTRGGGSLEDLWAFNEEAVARAIFHSALPVVSAIGHEIDFTISDFVADFRAPTPSAAAEILTEGVFAGARRVAQVPAQLAEKVRRRLLGERRHFEQLARRLQTVHPRRQWAGRRQQADEWQMAISRCARRQLQKLRQAWQAGRERLARFVPAGCWRCAGNGCRAGSAAWENRRGCALKTCVSEPPPSPRGCNCSARSKCWPAAIPSPATPPPAASSAPPPIPPPAKH